MTAITFDRDQLESAERGVSRAYRDALVAAGVTSPEGIVSIDPERFAAVRAAHLRRPHDLPTKENLLKNFSGAMARWRASGYATVSRATYTQRMALCEACPHWDAKARLGMGRCRAPGCGCTRLKQWLATEECPIGKWPTSIPEKKQDAPSNTRTPRRKA